MSRGQEFLDAYQAERAKQKETGQYKGWDAAGWSLGGCVLLFVFILMVL